MSDVEGMVERLGKLARMPRVPTESHNTGPDGEPANTFRDGKVHVMRKQCGTCIYGPNALLKDTESGRQHMKEVKASAACDPVAGSVVCHSTLGKDNAACRGYVEAQEWPLAFRLASSMGALCFQDEDGTCDHQPPCPTPGPNPGAEEKPQ